MRIGSLGLPELLIILLVVLLIFGPRRLPEMAKGLGQSVREFRKGVKDMKEDFEAEADDEAPKKAPAKAVTKDAPATEAAAEPEKVQASTPAAEAVVGTAPDGDAKPKEG